MEKLKVGVVGVGYLGRHHARIYSELEEADLAGIVDIDQKRVEEVAGMYGTSAGLGVEELAGLVDAVSIVTPTVEHYRLAKFFLESGVDVLVEKPITVAVEEADELVEIAGKMGRILQVGHLERFNSGVMKMMDMVTTPMFIECNRLSPFPDRSTDVDVVLDLMIHDIDIILGLVRSPVSSIRAVGIPIISGNVDIANARLEFESGCVANITSSRISLKRERKIRLFQPDTYMSLNYEKQELYAYRRIVDQNAPKARPRIEGGKVKVRKDEPLKVELEAFLSSVATRKKPVVAGQEGREALKVALAVMEEINRRIASLPGPTGGNPYGSGDDFSTG